MPYKKIIAAVGIVILITWSITAFQSHFRLKPQETILIFSPHPDDAALCCAGYIQQSIDDGKTVYIVNVTNGDGYQEAAAKLARKPVTSLTTDDMRALGQVRQKEEQSAMNILGVPPSRITFLGYPDGWLDEVYKNTSYTPFINPNTNASFSAQTHQAFTRNSVHSDFVSLIQSLQPDMVLAPNALDSVDHQAVHQFTIDVLHNAGFMKQFYTYSIHKKDQIIQSPTQTIHLSNKQLEKKKRAIQAYTTQIAIDQEYLNSFATHSEHYYHTLLR